MVNLFSWVCKVKHFPAHYTSGMLGDLKSLKMCGPQGEAKENPSNVAVALRARHAHAAESKHVDCPPTGLAAKAKQSWRHLYLLNGMWRHPILTAYWQQFGDVSESLGESCRARVFSRWSLLPLPRCHISATGARGHRAHSLSYSWPHSLNNCSLSKTYFFRNDFNLKTKKTNSTWHQNPVESQALHVCTPKVNIVAPPRRLP